MLDTKDDTPHWDADPNAVYNALTQKERDDARIAYALDELRNWRRERALCQQRPELEAHHLRPEWIEVGDDWDDFQHLEPRHIAYGNLLVRGHVSLCGALGGTGKTARWVTAAVAKATGRDLLREGVHERERVWYICGEDDKDELLRRILACCLVHGIDTAELTDWLMVKATRNWPMIIAETQRGRVMTQDHVVEAMIRHILFNKIGTVILDPVKKVHRCDENSNGEMDEVISILSHMAEVAECSILALHHFHKGSNPAGDPDNFRGAVALINGSRAAETLTKMSADEARRFGIDPVKAWQFMRIDDAKENLFVPCEDVRWLQLVSAKLHTGDNIQTVKRYDPPDPKAGLSIGSEIYILEAIAEGMGDGEKYTAAHQAIGTDRYAGRVVEDLAIKSEAEAQTIIRTWLRSGVLRQSTYHSEERREDRGCCVVDLDKLHELRKNLV